jgi:hypothetical protein
MLLHLQGYPARFHSFNVATRPTVATVFCVGTIEHKKDPIVFMFRAPFWIPIGTRTLCTGCQNPTMVEKGLEKYTVGSRDIYPKNASVASRTKTIEGCARTFRKMPKTIQRVPSEESEKTVFCMATQCS